jgi:hypothetical protein
MKTTKTENATDILATSLTDLKKGYPEIYALIIDKANQGFFEQHQTTGTLKSLANDILKLSRKQEHT